MTQTRRGDGVDAAGVTGLDATHSHDLCRHVFGCKQVQKMNVLWDLNGVSVRLELPEPSSLESGGLGLGWRFGGGQRQQQPQHSQQVRSSSSIISPMFPSAASLLHAATSGLPLLYTALMAQF